MMNEKKGQGGKRIGAGRKDLYGEGEKTKRIMISIPASKEDDIRKKIDNILKRYRAKRKPTK